MEYIENLKKTIDNLKLSQHVKTFNTNDKNEAEILAIHLLDIKESSEKIIESIKLLSERQYNNEDKIDDMLFDIREELKHIFYHVYNSKFYKYVTYLYD